MTALYEPNSPLAQARRLRGASGRVATLSERDASALRGILAEPYDYMDHPLFELPRARAEQEILPLLKTRIFLTGSGSTRAISLIRHFRLTRHLRLRMTFAACMSEERWSYSLMDRFRF